MMSLLIRGYDVTVNVPFIYTVEQGDRAVSIGVLSRDFPIDHSDRKDVDIDGQLADWQIECWGQGQATDIPVVHG